MIHSRILYVLALGVGLVFPFKEEPASYLSQDEIIKLIREIICQYTKLRILNTGTVLRVVDGIPRIYGRNEVMAGELFKFQDGTVGICLHLDSKMFGIVLIGDDFFIQEGSWVVNKVYLNNILNSIIDGRREIPACEYHLIEPPATDIISVCSVYQPLLHTGLLTDSMIPIGGRRRKWIGQDRQRDKTTVGTDTILNNQGKNVRSAYVLLAKKMENKRADLVQMILQKSQGGELKYSIRVNEPLMIRPATATPKYCSVHSLIFVVLFLLSYIKR